MVVLNRIRTAITGFTGGPGVATMYFDDVETALASLHDFWAAVAAVMPESIRIQVEPSGDLIESTTGVLTGTWTATGVAQVSGATGTVYAGGVGAVVRWNTATVVGGSRLRGRTFLVPLSSNSYDSDGTLQTTPLGVIQAAATDLVSEQGGSFGIWHRPKATSDGDFAHVTQGIAVDKVAVLRSRRN